MLVIPRAFGSPTTLNMAILLNLAEYFITHFLPAPPCYLVTRHTASAALKRRNILLRRRKYETTFECEMKLFTFRCLFFCTCVISVHMSVYSSIEIETFYKGSEISSLQNVRVLRTSGKELLEFAPLALAGSRNMVGGVSNVRR